MHHPCPGKLISFICHQINSSPFQFITILICCQFNWSPFQFVAISIHHHIHLTPHQFVPISICQHDKPPSSLHASPPCKNILLNAPMHISGLCTIQNNTQCKLCLPYQNALETCILNTAHCTLHTAYCTTHTAHSILHTAHCTRQTAHYKLYNAHCTLHITLQEGPALAHFPHLT